MRSATPEELSALLDGELSPERSREVEAQIAADAELAREFLLLRESDARWHAAAATAVFQPAVRLSETPDRSSQLAATTTALVLTLVAVRMAPKLTGSIALGFGLQIVVLAVLLGAVAWFVRDADRSSGDRALDTANGGVYP